MKAKRVASSVDGGLDWTTVEVATTQDYDGPKPVSLGSVFEIRLEDLAETIARLTGFQGWLTWDGSKPNGQPRRKFDTSRAERLFGFHAQTRFEDGPRRTIDWYRSQALPTPTA